MAAFGNSTLAVICVLQLVSEMVQLHPYQYIYFNQVSGGVEQAFNRDETDYWGASHREAAVWLNELVEQSDASSDRVYKVQLYSVDACCSFE